MEGAAKRVTEWFMWLIEMGWVLDRRLTYRLWLRLRVLAASWVSPGVSTAALFWLA